MQPVYIGIGSNLGDAAANVRAAIERLRRSPDIQLLRCAALYGSKPFGPVAQDDFVNTVVEIACNLGPPELLRRLKQLEQEMGRKHGERWGPREIDLDILVFAAEQWHSAELNLPHPGIAERAFVLLPLAELAPTMKLSNGASICELAARVAPGLAWRLDDSFQVLGTPAPVKLKP